MESEEGGGGNGGRGRGRQWESIERERPGERKGLSEKERGAVGLGIRDGVAAGGVGPVGVCRKTTHGKGSVCRVSSGLHTAKYLFVVCSNLTHDKLNIFIIVLNA